MTGDDKFRNDQPSVNVPAQLLAALKQSAIREWLAARVTAVLLIPLAPWLAVSLLRLPASTHESFVGWIQNPLNSLALFSFLLASVYHARLGLLNVVTDYLSRSPARPYTLVAIDLLLAGILLGAFVAFIFLIRVH